MLHWWRVQLEHLVDHLEIALRVIAHWLGASGCCRACCDSRNDLKTVLHPVRRCKVRLAIDQDAQVHVNVVGGGSHQADVSRHFPLPVRPDQPQALRGIAGGAGAGIEECIAVEVDQGQYVVALASIRRMQCDGAVGEVYPGRRVKGIDDRSIGPTIFRRGDLAGMSEQVELCMGSRRRIVECDPTIVGQLVQRIGVVERVTHECLVGVEGIRLGRSTQ
ncbi:hypothetical protein D9M68_737890 [compost metagenome]